MMVYREFSSSLRFHCFAGSQLMVIERECYDKYEESVKTLDTGE